MMLEESEIKKKEVSNVRRKNRVISYKTLCSNASFKYLGQREIDVLPTETTLHPTMTSTIKKMINVFTEISLDSLLQLLKTKLGFSKTSFKNEIIHRNHLEPLITPNPIELNIPEFSYNDNISKQHIIKTSPPLLISQVTTNSLPALEESHSNTLLTRKYNPKMISSKQHNYRHIRKSGLHRYQYTQHISKNVSSSLISSYLKRRPIKRHVSISLSPITFSKLTQHKLSSKITRCTPNRSCTSSELSMISSVENLFYIIVDALWPFLTLTDLGRLSCVSYFFFKLFDSDSLWKQLYNRDVVESLKRSGFVILSRPSNDIEHRHPSKEGVLLSSVQLETSRSTSFSATLGFLSGWLFMRKVSSISSATDSYNRQEFGSFAGASFDGISGSEDIPDEINHLYDIQEDCQKNQHASQSVVSSTTQLNPTNEFLFLGLPMISSYKLMVLEEFAAVESEKNSVLQERITLLKDMQTFREELLELINQNHSGHTLPHLHSLLESRPDRSLELVTVITQLKPKVEMSVQRIHRSIKFCKKRNFFSV